VDDEAVDLAALRMLMGSGLADYESCATTTLRRRPGGKGGAR